MSVTARPALVEPSGNDTKGWEWTREKWVPSSPQFAKTTAQIDALSPSGCTVMTLKSYAKYSKNPENKLLLYRWAYATWKSYTRSMSWTDRLDMRQTVLLSLISVKHPYNYELARVRFLFDTDYTESRQLRSLGTKLLHRNPNDYDVQKGTIEVLAAAYRSDKSLGTKNALVAMGNKITASHHSSLDEYIAFGHIYGVIWETEGHRTEDAQKAIEQYKSYLRQAPANDGQRERVKIAIEYLSGSLSKGNSP